MYRGNPKLSVNRRFGIELASDYFTLLLLAMTAEAFLCTYIVVIDFQE